MVTGHDDHRGILGRPLNSPSIAAQFILRRTSLLYVRKRMRCTSVSAVRILLSSTILCTMSRCQYVSRKLISPCRSQTLICVT